VYIPENLLAGDIPVCGQPLYLKQTEKFFDGSALPTPAAGSVTTFAGIVAPVQPKQHLAELGIAIVTVVISGRAWVINDDGTNNVSADNCHPGAPYTLLGTRAGTIITPLDTENLILAVDLFPVARWTFDRRSLS